MACWCVVGVCGLVLVFGVCCRCFFLCFFFFQAEDGIRDDLVTGVQTCALPIYNNTHILFLVSYWSFYTGGQFVP